MYIKIVYQLQLNILLKLQEKQFKRLLSINFNTGILAVK